MAKLRLLTDDNRTLGIFLMQDQFGDLGVDDRWAFDSFRGGDSNRLVIVFLYLRQ